MEGTRFPTMFLYTKKGLNREIETHPFCKTKSRRDYVDRINDKSNLLLDTIFRRNLYIGETIHNHVGISSDFKRKYLGKNDNGKIVSMLLDLKVLSIDNSYNTGKQYGEPKVKGYAFNKNVGLNEIEKVGILCKKTEQDKRKIHTRGQKGIYKPSSQAIISNLPQLVTDPIEVSYLFSKAKHELSESATFVYEHYIETFTRFNSHETPSDFINDADFHFNSSNKVDRVYYPISTFPRKLKQAWRHKDGSKLVGIDGKATQPVMLFLDFIKHTNHPEGEKLLDIALNGEGFYKYVAFNSNKQIQALYNSLGYTDFKTNVLANGFFKKNYTQPPIYLALKQLFPAFMSYIDELKKENYKAANIAAQKAESSLYITGYFSKAETTIFSLPRHDEIICKENDAEQVKTKLENTLREQYPFVTKSQASKAFKVETITTPSFHTFKDDFLGIDGV